MCIIILLVKYHFMIELYINIELGSILTDYHTRACGAVEVTHFKILKFTQMCCSYYLTLSNHL